MHRAQLNHPPRVHHGHAIGDAGDNAQIMCDQRHRHTAFALEFGEQRKDLRLDGHIQRGGRLIGNQYLGIAGERDGDHHALAHAARQLVRILVEPARRIRDLHLFE